MTYYDCRICGYDLLTKPPANSYICPCCGTEFEADDFDKSPAELRAEWIERDMPWFSRSTLKPKNWSPYRQLIIADFGGDLVGHPRFKEDINYRYAVNKAFSEVRIAKQLKVLREEQAMTQLQLAEESEMRQSRISELEGMNYSSWSISTLERLARALGVRFTFAFEGWGKLLPEIGQGLSREALLIPAFERDVTFNEVAAQAAAAQSTYADDFTLVFSRLLSLRRTPSNVIDFGQPQKDMSDQRRTREKDQLSRAAALSSNLVEPPRRRLG